MKLRYPMTRSFDRSSAAVEVWSCFHWKPTDCLESTGGGKWGHFRIILRSFAWSSSFVFWDILSDWKVNSFSFMKWNNLGDVCEKTIAMFVFQMLYLAKAQINGRWQLVELLPIIWENRRASWLYESWLMKND